LHVGFFEHSVEIALIVGFFTAALLYSSVGHGGASGYLAVMALAGFAPTSMRGCALVMNVAVASIAWISFYRAGHFRAPQFWPLVLLAVPCAYLGGQHQLPAAIYQLLLGVVLVIAALLLLKPTPDHMQERHLPPALALPLGAGLGGLAGLTGVGGGIFLSPVLIFGRFAGAKQAGALAAGFIVLNSLAGLLAQSSSLSSLPKALPLWVIAAACGGVLGSRAGALWLSSPWVKRLLALVLLVAAVKLLWT
jgi:uncharacterized protein